MIGIKLFKNIVKIIMRIFGIINEFTIYWKGFVSRTARTKLMKKRIGPIQRKSSFGLNNVVKVFGPLKEVIDDISLTKEGEDINAIIEQRIYVEIVSYQNEIKSVIMIGPEVIYWKDGFMVVPRWIDVLDARSNEGSNPDYSNKIYVVKLNLMTKMVSKTYRSGHSLRELMEATDIINLYQYKNEKVLVAKMAYKGELPILLHWNGNTYMLLHAKFEKNHIMPLMIIILKQEYDHERMDGFIRVSYKTADASTHINSPTI